MDEVNSEVLLGVVVKCLHGISKTNACNLLYEISHSDVDQIPAKGIEKGDGGISKDGVTKGD